MSLPDWQRNGWLTAQQSSASEVRDLLGVIDRDLKDSAIDEISTDARLGMAYNAALKAATIALAAEGYRPSRDQAHYRVIQSLSLTIGATAAEITRLDAFRKKRNISDYDRAGTTSEAEVAELRTLAAGLRKRVLAWLAVRHPQLVNPNHKKE